MSERLTSSTEGPMLVAPREVLVCCVLPWSFPARVSCPMLRFTDTRLWSKRCVEQPAFMRTPRGTT